MQMTKYKLGDLIIQRREKNNNYNVPIRGVSKEGFIRAKQQEADTSIYNVFYKYDFVFNPARMELNSIALNIEYEKALCSSLYEVFYVKDENIVLPEFLNLHIKRDEFARHCDYIGLGSAREYCRFANISEFEIELPPIAVQQEIVDADRQIRRRIRLNEQMVEKLEATAQALYRHTFVDNIDKQNLPQGWRMGTFTEIARLSGGGTPDTNNGEYWGGDIPFFTPADSTKIYCIKTDKMLTELGFDNCSSKLYKKNTTFVTARGTVGEVSLAGCNMAMNQSCYALLPKNCDAPLFIHRFAINTVNKLKEEAVGAVFNALVTKDFETTEVIVPPINKMIEYNSNVESVYGMALIIQQENAKLTELQSLLLAKMGQ